MSTSYNAINLNEGYRYWRARADIGGIKGEWAYRRVYNYFNFDKCLDFDNVNDYATIANHTDFNAALAGVNRAFSVSLWFYMDTLKTSSISFINKMYPTVGSVFSWGLFYTYSSGNRFLQPRIYNLAGTSYISRRSDFNILSALTKYHVVFTYNGGTTPSALTLYINASRVDTTDITVGSFSVAGEPTNNVYLGTHNGSAFQDGKTDELSLYHCVLSQDDVTKLYQGGVGCDARSVQSAYLKGYWKCNQITDNLVTDYSGYNRPISIPASPSNPSLINWP